MAWNLIFKDATLFTCENSNAENKNDQLPITGLTLFFNQGGRLFANIDINLKSEKNAKILDSFSYFKPRVYSSNDKILKLEVSNIEENNILLATIDSVAPFGQIIENIMDFIKMGIYRINSQNNTYFRLLTQFQNSPATEMEMDNSFNQNSNSNITNNTNKSFAQQMDDLPGYMSDDESSEDEAFYDEDEALARALAETKLDSKEEEKIYSPRR